jgi:transcriptional regulator with XRE-family HTH domain
MRRRDQLIDKKIGATIRMQRVKLAMSQVELGKALGVTFQQIQKYESGTNSVASTRIGDLCRVLEFSPNQLFEISANLDDEALQLTSSDIKTILQLEAISPPLRRAFGALIEACQAKRGARGMAPRQQTVPSG